MKLAGFTLHYESGYLKKMNWLKISPIGKIDRKKIEQMLKTFILLLQYYQKFQTRNVAL